MATTDLLGDGLRLMGSQVYGWGSNPAGFCALDKVLASVSLITP